MEYKEKENDVLAEIGALEIKNERSRNGISILVSSVSDIDDLLRDPPKSYCIRCEGIIEEDRRELMELQIKEHKMSIAREKLNILANEKSIVSLWNARRKYCTVVERKA